MFKKLIKDIIKSNTYDPFTETYELISFKTKLIENKESRISGGFLLVLGGFSVETRTIRDFTITFLAKYKYGIQYKTINWDNKVYVNELEEKSTEVPRVDIYKEYCRILKEYYNKRVVFFVPKGSIIKEFNINI